MCFYVGELGEYPKGGGCMGGVWKDVSDYIVLSWTLSDEPIRLPDIERACGPRRSSHRDKPNLWRGYGRGE